MAGALFLFTFECQQDSYRTVDVRAVHPLLITNNKNNAAVLIPLAVRYCFVSIMSKSFKEEHPLGKCAAK
jgi:hypothetical protein